MDKFDISIESDYGYRCGEIYIKDDNYWYNCLYCQHNLKTVTAFKNHISVKHKNDLGTTLNTNHYNTEHTDSHNNNDNLIIAASVDSAAEEQQQSHHEHFTRKSFRKNCNPSQNVITGKFEPDNAKLEQPPPPQQQKHNDMKNCKYLCKICSKRFRTRLKLERHKLDIHVKSIQKKNSISGLISNQKFNNTSNKSIYKCKICKKQFDRPLLARQHEARCKISANAEWAKCKICCKRMFKETLKSHYEKLHPDYDDKDDLDTTFSHKKQQNRTEYSCLSCKKTFTNISDTRLHEESCEKSSLNWIKCSICGVYMFQNKLQEHMLIRHNVSDASLNDTVISTVKDEPDSALKCKVCGKTFAYRRLVMQHERRCETTFNAEWTKCSQCGKRMFKHTLQNHIEKIHPDIIPSKLISGIDHSFEEIDIKNIYPISMNKQQTIDKNQHNEILPETEESCTSYSDVVHMDIVDEHGNIVSKNLDELHEEEIEYCYENSNSNKNQFEELKIEILYDEKIENTSTITSVNSPPNLSKFNPSQGDNKKVNNRRKHCQICNRVMGDIYEHRKVCGKNRKWTTCRICGYHMFEAHIEGHMERQHPEIIKKSNNPNIIDNEEQDDDDDNDSTKSKSETKIYNENTEDTADNADIDETTKIEYSSEDEAYTRLFLSDNEENEDNNKTNEYVEMQLDENMENSDANIIALCKQKKSKKRKPCNLCGRYYVNVSEHQLNSCGQPKNRVTCKICGVHVFARNLQRHLDLHKHKDSPELKKNARRKCQYCHKDFLTRWGSVERHEKYCSNLINRQKCKYCKYYISTINMEKHIKNKHFDKDGNLSNIASTNHENYTEKDLQKLPCRYCNELFLRPFMHEQRCIARTSKEWARCEICSVLVLKSRMNIHMNKIHSVNIVTDTDVDSLNNKMKPDGDDDGDVGKKTDYVKCNLCGSHILTNNFQYHILRKHQDKIPLKQNEILDYNMLGKIDLKQFQCETSLVEWVKCKFCGINVSEPSLPSHLDLHKKFGKARGAHFQCTICKLKLNARSMDKHLRTKHLNDKNSTVCKLCENDKRIHNAYYENHLKWHSGELKSFDCQICKRKYEFKYNLDRHMIVHEKEPACKCDICGKEFQNNNRLSHHKQIHSTDAKFQCDTCGKSFILKARLQSHQLSHLDRKFFRFPCSICNKRFNAKAKLSDHMITHTRTKDYSCTICDAKFARKFDAIKHQRRHTEIGHLMCSVCKRRFFLKRPLRDHLRTNHGIMDESAIIDTRIQVVLPEQPQDDELIDDVEHLDEQQDGNEDENKGATSTDTTYEHNNDKIDIFTSKTKRAAKTVKEDNVVISMTEDEQDIFEVTKEDIEDVEHEIERLDEDTENLEDDEELTHNVIEDEEEVFIEEHEENNSRSEIDQEYEILMEIDLL